MRRTLTTTAAALAGLLMAQPALAGPPCNADLDGDGYVGQSDLGVLLASYNMDAGGDLDGDGDTDQADLGQLLAEYGEATAFDFGPAFADAEAAQIGLELLGPDGPLLLDADTYNRIDRDLDLIRAFEPLLQGEPHSMAWAPNQVLLRLEDDVDLQEFNCLNEYYQVNEVELISDSLNLYLLHFDHDFNVPAMSAVYDALDAVRYAEPNYLIGGQNFWVPTDMGDGTWRWDIDDGFWDCFDGCDCHRLYTIDVHADGTVELIDYQEVGWDWCDFGG